MPRKHRSQDTPLKELGKKVLIHISSYCLQTASEGCWFTITLSLLHIKRTFVGIGESLQVWRTREGWLEEIGTTSRMRPGRRDEQARCWLMLPCLFSIIWDLSFWHMYWGLLQLHYLRWEDLSTIGGIIPWVGIMYCLKRTLFLDCGYNMTNCFKSLLLWHHHHDGLQPETVSRNKPFSPEAHLLRLSVIATEKVTNTMKKKSQDLFIQRRVVSISLYSVSNSNYLFIFEIY